MTDGPHLDSMGNEIDPDEFGELITPEQATAMFDQRLAAWRDMVRGFAEPPTGGEPVPFLSSYYLPIVNDALLMFPEAMIEFASLGILFAADYLRVHGEDPIAGW